MTSPLLQSTVRTGLGLLAVVFLAGCAGAPRWGAADDGTRYELDEIAADLGLDLA